MSAHTPGPWTIKTLRTMISIRCGRQIVAVLPYALKTFDHRWENARLIAAAPDLLEALQALLADVGAANSMLGAVKARAAIQKAEGAKP